MRTTPATCSGHGRLADKTHAQGRHHRSGHRRARPVPAPHSPESRLFARRVASAVAEQKIDHLIGLDRAAEILSWGPITELDPLRQSFQMQVLRVFLLIGLKAVLDGTLAREAARERDRERILEELSRGFAERAARDA